MTSGTQKTTGLQPSVDGMTRTRHRLDTLTAELHRNFVHIRWPVQAYVVLGFVFGALIAKYTISGRLVLGLVAWFLICAGLTVFNSYYDKDEAPVGGMADPPKVTVSLLYGSLAMQITGLGIAAFLGLKFFVLAAVVVVLYILYSHRAFRFKSNGFAAVSINATLGVLTVLAVVSLGRAPDTLALVLAALAAACFKAGVYMMMQVHQIAEDRERGDISVAVKFGRTPTLRAAMAFLAAGGVFAAAALVRGIHGYVVAALVLAYFVLIMYRFRVWIRRDEDPEQDYAMVRQMVYLSGWLGSVVVVATFVYYSTVGY